MHFHILTTLLLSTLTLASPVAMANANANAQEASSQTTIPSADGSTPERIITIPPIPSSIMTVLATAIPPSWYEEIMNPHSRSIISSEIMDGTMPAWYNALPASVKSWASSAGGLADNFVSATPTAGATPAAFVGSASDGVAIATATPIATADTKFKAHASASGSIASTASHTAAAASSTSTGGAPVATGSVAMSVAGVAGLLGLALAL